MITYEEWWRWEQRRLNKTPYCAASRLVYAFHCARCHRRTEDAHWCQEAWCATHQIPLYEKAGLTYDRWQDHEEGRP